MSTPAAVNPLSRTLATTSNLSSQEQKRLHSISRLEAPKIIAEMGKVKASESVLTRFVKSGTVSKNFFNSEQEKVLRSLFTKWHLDGDIRLIDLLGLEIYTKIEKIFGNSEEKECFKEHFMINLMFCYLSFFHEAEDGWKKLKTNLTSGYFGEEKISPNNLQNICKQLLKILDVKKDAIGKMALNPTSKQLLLKSLNDSKAEFIELTNLLVQCLSSKSSYDLLYRMPIRFFGGGELISEPSGTQDPVKEVLDHSRRFGQYVEALFKIGFNKSALKTTIKMELFTDLLQKSPKEMLGASKKIYKQKEALLRSMCDERKNLADALTGKLTYSQWITQQDRQRPFISQNDFIEELKQRVAIMATGTAFLDDLHRLIDSNVMPTAFPGQYVPRSLLSQRHEMNILLIGKDKKIDDQNPFRRAFRDELNRFTSPLAPLIDGLIICSNRMKTLLIGNQRESESKHLIDDKVTRGYVFNELSESYMAQYTPHTAPFKQLMSSLAEKMPQIFENLAPLLQELPQSEKNIESLQKIAFEECLVLCRVALILRDIEALAGKNELDADIPEELANLMELEGIELYLRAPQKPLPASAVAAVSQDPVVDLEVKALVYPVEAPIKPASVSVQPKEKEFPMPASVEESVEKFTLESRNVRKVIKKLIDAGFKILRTKGSHEILTLSGSVGGQVVVPYHGGKDVLKQGTAASIQEQARIALNQAPKK
jgi:predicted RNA binding protein YcfA (HicA-like mRNA interferase family)